MKNDVEVFGFEVKNFPEGKKEAWDELTSMFNKKPGPVFYGIGDMSEPHFKYSVAATEKSKDGSERKDCEEYIIEKGNYLTITLKNWRSK